MKWILSFRSFHWILVATSGLLFVAAAIWLTENASDLRSNKGVRPKRLQHDVAILDCDENLLLGIEDCNATPITVDSNIQLVSGIELPGSMRRLPSPNTISNPEQEHTPKVRSTSASRDANRPALSAPDKDVTEEVRGASRDIWLLWHQELNRDQERAETSATAPRKQILQQTVSREVATRAAASLQEAISLGRRKAYFCARQEFVNTLRTIAQGLDASLPVQHHTQALTRGLTALRESEDFSLGQVPLESDLHVAGYVSGHQTPVLKGESLESITPTNAMSRYLQYAHQQLAESSRGNPIASQALYGLGKIEGRLAAEQSRDENRTTRQITFYHAALSTTPSNSLAANELGVLLARAGQTDRAIQVLSHAAKTAPTQAILNNLAKLQYQVGDVQSLAQTRGLTRQLTQAGTIRPNNSGPRLTMLSQEQFIQQSGPDLSTRYAPPVRPVQHLTPDVRPAPPKPEPKGVSRVLSAMGLRK